MTPTAATARSDASVIAYLAFLGVLMATGIDIALPAFDEIDADLGAGGNESLIVSAYLIGSAFGQLVFGPVADRYGRRPAICAGVLLYLVGAAASALAPSFGLLLAARTIWGFGAAAPVGLRAAIVRDLYDGDAMARILTIVMAVFLLGPVFIPLVGEGILRVASWPFVFWFAAALALVAGVWAARFGETLADEHRRPISPAKFADALMRIARTRVTFWLLIANMLLSAAFFIFLGSSQPVFNRVFGRADQFALLFAVSGLVTIPLLLLNNRAIDRFGAARVVVTATFLTTAAAVTGWALTVFTGGEIGFWPWYGWLLAVTSTTTLATAPLQAVALEPMGDLAGTVSSLLYFTGFAVGALLAAFFGAAIETSVTPFMAGYALYTAIGCAAVLAAGLSPARSR